MNNLSVRLLLLLIVALFAGCVTVPERPPVESPHVAWQARKSSLAQVSAWDIRGRLALRTVDEGFQASLQWTRDVDRHRIELAGPLGGGRVRLTQDKNGAELRDANDKIYRDTSVQQLLMRTTGWQLPLEGLNYWVLGLPAPGAEGATELDAWGRLKTLQQGEWEIRFLEYADYGGKELPVRIFIKRQVASPTDRTLELRLVIERWTLKS